MERVWKDEAELKAVITRLDPVTREAAKEYGRLLSGNPDIDPSDLFTYACARALGAVGGTNAIVEGLLRLTDEQNRAIVVVGMAIAQWWEEAQKGNVHDVELALILNDREAIDRHMEDIVAQLSQSQLSDTGHRKSPTAKTSQDGCMFGIMALLAGLVAGSITLCSVLLRV